MKHHLLCLFACSTAVGNCNSAGNDRHYVHQRGADPGWPSGLAVSQSHAIKLIMAPVSLPARHALDIFDSSAPFMPAGVQQVNLHGGGLVGGEEALML